MTNGVRAATHSDDDVASRYIDAVRALLDYCGEDPAREGLANTPHRVLRAWRELTAGYATDPADVLAVTFSEPCDEMVVLRGIEFYSTCEHHMMQFAGTASVGYVPNGSVVGLSKLARLVDIYARRLQIQERLTQQVALALMEHLDARGAACIVRARHACMGCRGVRKPSAEMVTSAMLGVFRSKPEARAEFLELVRDA